MIVKYVRNICQIKHSRLKAYINEVWHYVENYFQAFNISTTPREITYMQIPREFLQALSKL